jgi:hypothetical protein
MNNALATVIDKGDRLYEGLNLDLLIDSKHWIPFIDVFLYLKIILNYNLYLYFMHFVFLSV